MSNSENDTPLSTKVIYSVEYHDYDSRVNYGLFSSKEKAEEQLREIQGKYHPNDKRYFTIEEYYYDQSAEGWFY